jgi:hypothetical protein
LGRIAFGEYASRWYEAQDLAASTMWNYRRHIEELLLSAFEDQPIEDILATDIAAWEKRELAVPYAPSSVKTRRRNAAPDPGGRSGGRLRDSNPAQRRRGRGKCAGRSRHRGPEKPVTDPLGMLLIAERAALLSGRDDEFIAVTLLAYTGIRWGERSRLMKGLTEQGLQREAALDAR